MTKRLYRSKQKLIGGVLGGLAEYFHHDPVFWRLGFIVLLLVTGFMPFTAVYLIAWVIIPEAPQVEPLTKDSYTEKKENE